MTRAWRLRAGPGALIVLGHLVFLAILLRHAGTPPLRDDPGAIDTIGFMLVPARSTPQPVEAAAPSAPPKRRTVVRREQPVQPALAQPPAAPEALAEEAQPAGAKGLDMEALRSAARRMERERVPTALERLRESEQMRSEEDSPLARGIQRAKRPDCQTAYAGGEKANIFMLVPLVIDTIRDKGCKW